jgi:PD-(D/E)XK nuclease superfamily
LCAQFHYNKAFAFQPNREMDGSWTRKMQPDYTLTVWPANYTLAEAEAQELVVHIHLDAKYRVDKLEDLFRSAEEDALDALETSRNAKRADLLKMHAYRDAVRRSEGAYVLYPGNDQDRAKQWRVGDEVHSNNNVLFGFHEILPGLGAFAISPGPNGQAKGLAQLQSFLDAALEHLCNRATQREQRAYHVFDAKRVAETQPPVVRRALRETDDDGYRAEPPYEHLIVTTWYERADELTWMLKQGFAVLRLGQRRGALPIVKKLSAASHMLFRSHVPETQSGLFSILDESGQVLTRREMIGLGYPDPAPI